MTKLLSITAPPETPIACDMTDAQDTFAERLAEYGRLFDHALVSRTSTDDETTFRFAASPGVQEWVLDLVRKEAACCPFLSYEVDLVGEEVVWLTRGLGESDWTVLDEFLGDAATHGGCSTDVAKRLESRGGIPVIVPEGEM